MRLSRLGKGEMMALIFRFKVCFKCEEEKPLTEYYAHPEMKDGTFGKCKSCCKTDATKNRAKNIDYYREYDRTRGYHAADGYTKQHRLKNPEKYKAHQAVNNAKRAGILKEQPCQECGSTKVQAHHPDYSQPLEVVWVCAIHHKQLHLREEVCL